MSQREKISEPIKRQIRQEAYFGCVKCGNPIIEYHHIIPYSETRDNSAKNLVLVCPICHKEFQSSYSPETQREFKENPFNRDNVSYQFRCEGEDVKIDVGTNIGINLSNILRIDGENIVTLKREDGLVFLTAYFYSQENELILSIVDNECLIDIHKVWDIEYKLGKNNIQLIIKKKFRDVILNLIVKPSEIKIEGKMYFNGVKFIMKKNGAYIYRGLTRISSISASTVECSECLLRITTGLLGHDLPLIFSGETENIFREIDGSVVCFAPHIRKIRKGRNEDGSWVLNEMRMQKYYF